MVRSTPEDYFVKTLLQKVLTLVIMTSTVPEVFVATKATFISDSCDALEETIIHIKGLKLKSYPGENNTGFCAEILVSAVKKS